MVDSVELASEFDPPRRGGLPPLAGEFDRDGPIVRPGGSLGGLPLLPLIWPAVGRIWFFRLFISEEASNLVKLQEPNKR